MVKNRIKTVLVDKNIMQSELATKIGKSYSVINSYCCNRTQPSLEVLGKIAEVLSVDIKDLIREQKEESITKGEL